MVELLRYRDDAAPEAAPVSLAEFLADPAARAVRLVPGDDARTLLDALDRLALIDVVFPAFTDGRGYSAARILREAGYRGELRASGDVLIDQLSHLARCGFDSFAPAAPLDRATADAALATWPQVYQRTVDGRPAVWAQRHHG